MESLKILCLDETQVTDAGIDHLLHLSKLERVSCHSTDVTAEGARKLRQAIPGCRVEFGQPPGVRLR